MNRYAYLAPVILRIALGAVFIAHGLPKLLHPVNFTGFFGTIGIPAPRLAVPLIGLVEAGGGLMLLAGWELDFVLLAAAVSRFLSGPLGVGEANRRRV